VPGTAPPSVYPLSLHDALPIFGACRTCLVQVEGQRGTPAACHLPARDGMAVSTTHPEVVRVRRTVLDLTRSMLTSGSGRDGFGQDRKSTRLNSSHDQSSYAVFC